MMRRSLVLSAIVLLGVVVLTGLGQQTVSTGLQLQKLLVNEQEVQSAFDSTAWTQQAKVDVNQEPAHTQFSAALIYDNSQTSLLTTLFQFRQENQAHDYFVSPITAADKTLSRESQDALKKPFAEAVEVKLVKIRLGVRKALSEDEQQLVLRFRVGQIVASYSIRLCIPAHPDAGAMIPYQCFNEAQLKAGLIKVGQTQLGILLNGR